LPGSLTCATASFQKTRRLSSIAWIMTTQAMPLCYDSNLSKCLQGRVLEGQGGISCGALFFSVHQGVT
jgi:hypothetical protein